MPDDLRTQLETILDADPAPDAVKAQAWDAFLTNRQKKGFESAFSNLAISDESKKKLWDMKFPILNNPGNIMQSGEFVKYDSPQAGWDALRGDLRSKMGGKTSRGLTAKSTIQQLGEVWAPRGHGDNDPVAWAKNVSTHLGVSPSTPIGKFQDRLDDFAQAIAVAEGTKVPFFPEAKRTSKAKQTVEKGSTEPPPSTGPSVARQLAEVPFTPAIPALARALGYQVPTATQSFDYYVDKIKGMISKGQGKPYEQVRKEHPASANVAEFLAGAARFVPEMADFLTTPAGAAIIASFGVGSIPGIINRLPGPVKAAVQAYFRTEMAKPAKEFVTGERPRTAGSAGEAATSALASVTGLRRPKAKPSKIKPQPLSVTETQQVPPVNVPPRATEPPPEFSKATPIATSEGIGQRRVPETAYEPQQPGAKRTIQGKPPVEEKPITGQRGAMPTEEQMGKFREGLQAETYRASGLPGVPRGSEVIFQELTPEGWRVQIKDANGQVTTKTLPYKDQLASMMGRGWISQVKRPPVKPTAEVRQVTEQPKRITGPTEPPPTVESKPSEPPPPTEPPKPVASEPPPPKPKPTRTMKPMRERPADAQDLSVMRTEQVDTFENFSEWMKQRHKVSNEAEITKAWLKRQDPRRKQWEKEVVEPYMATMQGPTPPPPGSEPAPKATEPPPSPMGEAPTSPMGEPSTSHVGLAYAMDRIFGSAKQGGIGKFQIWAEDAKGKKVLSIGVNTAADTPQSVIAQIRPIVEKKGITGVWIQDLTGKKMNKWFTSLALPEKAKYDKGNPISDMLKTLKADERGAVGAAIRPMRDVERKMGGRGYWVSPQGELVDLAQTGADIPTHTTFAQTKTGVKDLSANDKLFGQGWIRVRGATVEADAKALDSVGFMTAVEAAAENARNARMPFIQIEAGGLMPVSLKDVPELLADPKKFLGRRGALKLGGKEISRRIGEPPPIVG